MITEDALKKRISDLESEIDSRRRNLSTMRAQLSRAEESLAVKLGALQEAQAMLGWNESPEKAKE